MTTFFLDEKNGDDANDGLSLEQAVKTYKRIRELREEHAKPVDATIWWDGSEWHYSEKERANV